MKISIFTGTHNSQYLGMLYDSIKDQAFDEWVIVWNNVVQKMDFKDRRVKYFNLPFESGYVGAIKKYACQQCTGDILVEVDHDDLLMPNAIEEIRKAFSDPEIGFVYSKAANFKENFEKTAKYDVRQGWEFTDVEYQGHILEDHKAWNPIPAAVSRIWFAPNHVRAWRKDKYWEAGGHAEDMRVLDDQDLIARTYLVTKFKLIDKCLYLYRIDGNNTWLKYNDEIQNNVYRLYDKYIEQLALKWAKDKDLLCLDLGGRLNSKEGYQTVDLKDTDYIADLNREWPFPDNSGGVIRAFDVFEHLTDSIHTMKELSRVLAPGGYAFVQVPSTDGRGAFQDPTHKTFWNENSFLYYTHRDWAKYIDSPVRFQTMRIYTTDKNKEQVCWTVAHLVNLKDGYRPPGLIEV